MSTSLKFVCCGLMGLFAAALAPLYAQHGPSRPTCTTGNCHWGSTQRITGQVPKNQYRPNYISEKEMRDQLKLEIQRSLAFTQQNMMSLQRPHAVGVGPFNGLSHCASGDRTGIRQNFDTNPRNYTSYFGSVDEFLRQRVYFGGVERQPYLNMQNSIRFYCPGGCTQRH